VGLDVSAVAVPVLVRYGLTDVLVPPAHGEWLAANVRGCIVAIRGHLRALGENPEDSIAIPCAAFAATVAARRRSAAICRARPRCGELVRDRHGSFATAQAR
jgi:pimeloyl-ACP methyl ester carboxylesterase